MDYKQIKFRCPEADSFEKTKIALGGIAIYDSSGNLQSVICGCCGGTFSPYEVEIIRVFEWLPISSAILGE